MKQTKLFWIVTAATIGWIIFMRPHTPKNIVQFEFAKSVESAGNIITTWGDVGVVKATTSIYLDFVFIILYSTAIMLGCKVSSEYSKRELLIKSGSLLSIFIWLAGLCDVIENIAMLKTLEAISQTTTSIAFYFAAIKFCIVGVCLLFMIVASLTGLVKKS